MLNLTRTLSFRLQLRSLALGATEREDVTLAFELEYRGPLRSRLRVSADWQTRREVNPDGVAALRSSQPDGRGGQRVVAYQDVEARELERALQLALAGWNRGPKDKPGNGRQPPLSWAEKARAHEELLESVAREISVLLPESSPRRLSLPQAQYGEGHHCSWD